MSVLTRGKRWLGVRVARLFAWSVAWPYLFYFRLLAARERRRPRRANPRLFWGVVPLISIKKPGCPERLYAADAVIVEATYPSDASDVPG